MNNNDNILELLDTDNVKTEFFMEEEVVLSTIEVKRAMKNYFKHIQVRSSAATLLLTKFGLTEAAALNQKTIDDQLNKFVQDMSQDVQHTKSIIDDAGIKNVVTVNGLLKGKIKITSPTGFQFLNLLKLWDELNINLTTLYMRQEIGQQEVTKSTTQWSKRIKKFNNTIESLSVTAYKATEQLKQQSRDKAEQRRLAKTKPVKNVSDKKIKEPSKLKTTPQLKSA